MTKSRSNSKTTFQEYENSRKQLATTDHALTFLYGSSECLLEYAIDTVKQRAKASGAETITIEGTGLSESSFEAMTGQSTLFEPVTVYLVRRSEQSKILSKILKQLKPIFSSKKIAGHRIVMVWSGGEPPVSMMSELKRLQAFMVACMDPWPREVPQFIQSLAAELGVSLDSAAVHLMIEANGLDLVKQKHELTKIALLKSGSSQSIRRDELAPLLGLLRQDDAFQLDRLLLQKHWDEAHALIDALLARGEKSLGLLAIVAGHCRNIIKINAALSRGLSAAHLPKETRLPTFLLKSYIPAAEQADIPRYVQALKLCHEADLALKSSALSANLLLGQILSAFTAAP